MRYFLNDNGGWLTVSGDMSAFGDLPSGYHEVTEDEYHQAAGTIVLELPKDPPANNEQRAAAPAKAGRSKAR
ncbi:hypothetical protein FSY75_09185 [Streptomyces sp. TR1341]|uniref:hypothetical protein n=1 Tax=Streptomyces sp. TR1341 TaxID=2601266 RepID=UPI00138AC31F|nr:hypothetical protein [Streptomyces sp. TR1341]